LPQASGTFGQRKCKEDTFSELHTGKRVSRNNFSVLPMSTKVITAVDAKT